MLWIILGIYLTISLPLAAWLTWSALSTAKHYRNKFQNENFRYQQTPE